VLTPLDELDPFGSEEDVPLWVRKARRKQGVWRNQVALNFGNCCFLTGTKTSRYLEAAHIIPYSKEGFEHFRYDPGNGVLLYPDYHGYFDDGLFTFDEQRKIILTPRLSQLDPYVQDRLGVLEGKEIPKTRQWSVNPECLKWHRENVFDKFSIES
jgi:predicted restriction endonuclease